MVCHRVQFLGHSYFWYIYIYINDMNRVIQHSEMHHFADDTNLLYSTNSMKKINRYINNNLKVIVHWLRANRISLNVDKT